MSQELRDLDIRLTSRLRVAERPGGLRTLAVILAHSGDSLLWLPGLLLLWWLGTDFWRGRARALIIGIVITAAVVTAVKLVVRRRRPAGEWGKLYRKTDPHSFPSGHAARVFMLAVMTIGFGPVWFAATLAVWAPLVSLARAAMGVHYLSDVLAGMALGAAIGVILTVV